MAQTYPCPRCCEKIIVGAEFCRFCDHELTDAERSRAANSTRTRNVIFGIGAALLLGWCVSTWPGMSYIPHSAIGDGAAPPTSAPVARVDVRIDDAYSQASKDALCADRYPTDFSMRAACGRNSDSGRSSFIEIWNRHLSDPAMGAALEQCFVKYTEGTHTDFSMIGACARNQESGYRDTIGQ